MICAEVDEMTYIAEFGLSEIFPIAASTNGKTLLLLLSENERDRFFSNIEELKEKM